MQIYHSNREPSRPTTCFDMPRFAIIQADKHRKHGLLTQLYLPKFRWHSVSMDWMSFKRYPKTIGTTVYDAVLVFVDRGTKMVHLTQKLRRKTADETVQRFNKHVVNYHRIPRSIQSDRDTKLASDIWNFTCAKLDIKHCMTEANWPHANGQAKRTNGTVLTICKSRRSLL